MKHQNCKALNERVKKILVSQPKPSSEKSPYYDLAEKYGVELVFRPFIKVEGFTSREFRHTKIVIGDYSAIIFTARTAVDHFFRLCRETRHTVPDTLKYFCTSEAIANYLQKYIIYRKRKIFFSETGRIEELVPLILKHNKETYLMPVSEGNGSVAADVLDAAGVTYVKAPMYRTVSNDFSPEEPFDYDMLIFFSPAGVHSLVTNFPDYKERGIVIGAMGVPTIEAVHEAGLSLDVTVDAAAPSMAAAIDRYLKAHQPATDSEEEAPQ